MLPTEKVPDRRSDFGGVRLQREVTSVEEADLGTRDIALECFCSRGQEESLELPVSRSFRTWRTVRKVLILRS